MPLYFFANSSTANKPAQAKTHLSCNLTDSSSDLTSSVDIFVNVLNRFTQPGPVLPGVNGSSATKMSNVCNVICLVGTMICTLLLMYFLFDYMGKVFRF